METEVFKAKVRALGLDVIESGAIIHIKGKTNFNIMTCRNDEMFAIDTRCSDFYKESVYLRKTLMDLAVVYISTPIELRKKAKLFKIRLKNNSIKNTGLFLNFKIETREYVLASAENSALYKTIFTEEEITKIDMNGLEKVEVTQ